MGHEVARLVEAEDDHGEIRIVIDPPDESTELVDGIRVQQVDRPVVEGHPPVGRRDLIDVDLFGGIHDGDSLSCGPSSGRGRTMACVVLVPG